MLSKTTKTEMTVTQIGRTGEMIGKDQEAETKIEIIKETTIKITRIIMMVGTDTIENTTITTIITIIIVIDKADSIEARTTTIDNITDNIKIDHSNAEIIIEIITIMKMITEITIGTTTTGTAEITIGTTDQKEDITTTKTITITETITITIKITIKIIITIIIHECFYYYCVIVFII